MDENYLITKSNYFIMNCNYDLSLEEQKIILTLASMVQPEDEDFKPYKFKIADFIELLGVENQAKYTEIPKITKELMKKVFEIQEGDTLIQTAWLSGAMYKKGTGIVELTFSSYLKPYMIKLSSMFTQYKLSNILSMKSKYSPRIYEILKCNEFKKQGFIEIEVEELRKLIKAENVYPKYNDFKRYIVERTQKELKKISDICFEIEEIKTGRKVTSLKFYIKVNNKSNSKQNEEVSVTLVEDPKEFNIEIGTREVLKILQGHKFNSMDALKIYQNANGDIQYIEKVYEYSKTQDIENLIGFMKKMVVPGALKINIKTVKATSFNDYPQRTYDYNDLEKKLLGWDNSKSDDSGEEFFQEKINV